MGIITILYILIFIIVSLVAFAVMQLNLAGIKVKDFWTFIEANQMLDKLYAFSKRCEKLSPQEQIIFFSEPERIFDAFEKVPDILWEEEYEKYEEVLSRYQNIKVLRWASN